MLFSHSNTLFCILLNASPDVSTSILFLHLWCHSILLLLFFALFCFAFEEHYLDFPCDVFLSHHLEFPCDVFLCHHLDFPCDILVCHILRSLVLWCAAVTKAIQFSIWAGVTGPFGSFLLLKGRRAPEIRKLLWTFHCDTECIPFCR